MRRLLALMTLLVACTYVSIETPKSQRTSIGASVEYTVYVGCGLRQSLFDLDGSLWVPVGVTDDDLTRVPTGFQAPDDAGILTLVTRDRAQYESSQGRTIELTRHEGSLEIPSGCD
jgi:hypothetical protein